MGKKEWQSAIEKALRGKGFNKKAARKTAKATIRKSIEKRELKQSRQPPVVSEYEPNVPSGALYQPNGMAGKIVVITPKL